MSEPSQRIHRTAAVLSIGDELVIGQSLDTNSKWLSSRLTDLGIRVVEHATVSDEPDLLRAAFERLVSSVDLLLATGGLGPTADDLTRLTWYVTDKQEYLARQREVGQAYRRVLGRHFPAMTMVVVSALIEDEALVEIEATAVIGR